MLRGSQNAVIMATGWRAVLFHQPQQKMTIVQRRSLRTTSVVSTSSSTSITPAVRRKRVTVKSSEGVRGKLTTKETTEITPTTSTWKWIPPTKDNAPTTTMARTTIVSEGEAQQRSTPKPDINGEAALSASSDI